ncbi:TPA: hypothetical protein ON270_000417 [Serratia marcescens]|nr:hypothetical protein [Serratia marcescens]HCR2996832.1 hypothetical protein [Serratia marcescens]HCR3016263.1 hypothetical protein [Serratia marcescens]
MGRITTQDPVGVHGGLNLYLYAANPLMWLDPLGLSSKPCKTEKTPEDSYEKARGKVLK